MSLLASGYRFLALAAVIVLIAGCAPVSSSNIVKSQEAWTGKVFITEVELPASIQYDVVGTVKAKARTGYNSDTTLYPLIADEARTAGANTVMNIEGWHSPSAWSWGAPHVSGTAVRVQDMDSLNGVDGSYY